MADERNKVIGRIKWKGPPLEKQMTFEFFDKGRDMDRLTFKETMKYGGFGRDELTGILKDQLIKNRKLKGGYLIYKHDVDEFIFQRRAEAIPFNGKGR